MRDRLTKQRRSWNMSRIRGRNTSPELIVRKLLHRMGYRFRVHVRIPVPEGVREKLQIPSSRFQTSSNRKAAKAPKDAKKAPVGKGSFQKSKHPLVQASSRQRIRFIRPDIVLPKYKTVIFVHGCFWHRHRGCAEVTG